MARLTRTRAYGLQLFSTLAGLAVSIYLLVQHTRLKNGIQGSSSFCSFGRYADCDVVNSSTFSDVLGFPLASIGALYYGLLFCLAILSPPSHSSFARTQRLFGRLAIAGLVTDFMLFGVQILVLRNFCLMCFGTYLTTIVALISALKLTEGGAPNWIARVGTLISKKRKLARASLHNTIAASVTFVAIAATVFLAPSFVVHSSSRQRTENSIEKFMEEFRDQQKRDIEVKRGDGTMGNSASRLRMVVFSDFECPHCQYAAFTIKNALQQNSERIFLVFKHFPLDSSCNRLVNVRMHENACKLARLSYCANKKNRFWDFHDRVFNRTSKSERPSWDEYKETISGVLSEKEITNCLNDSGSLRNVQADIDLGNQLELRGTPSVFINGKLISIPITVDTLRRLIEIESAL